MYTGVTPKGLWALTFDAELDAFANEDRGEGFGSRDYSSSINAVLAYAWAHSNEGRGYVTTAAAQWGKTSTASNVRTSLFGNISQLREQERAYYIAKATEAAGYMADTGLLDAIKASVDSTAADSDYGRNLRVILAGETVSPRNLGILASLVKVYARKMQIEAERKANPIAKGFIGDIKQRIKNITLHLTTVREIDGHYGTTTLLIGRTGDGHVVKWFATGAFDYEAGDTLNLEAATVKDHEVYEGHDQTVITRAKIDTFTQRAESYQAYLDAHNGEDEGFVTQEWDYAANAQREYTVYEIDRWLGSKAEKRRFTEWQKTQN